MKSSGSTRFGPSRAVAGRQVLVLSKAPEPLDQMSDEDIDAWAKQLVDGMAGGMNRQPG